jgi:hypothetical protein
LAHVHNMLEDWQDELRLLYNMRVYYGTRVIVGVHTH